MFGWTRSKLPSLQDHYLPSYEVNCEFGVIKPLARHPDLAEAYGASTVVLSGVEGYRFKDGAT